MVKFRFNFSVRYPRKGVSDFTVEPSVDNFDDACDFYFKYCDSLREQGLTVLSSVFTYVHTEEDG